MPKPRAQGPPGLPTMQGAKSPGTQGVTQLASWPAAHEILALSMNRNNFQRDSLWLGHVAHVEGPLAHPCKVEAVAWAMGQTWPGWEGP